MSFKLGNTSTNSPRKKSTDAVVDSVDLGTTNSTGRVLIYTGAQPATPETAPTGTLLATINFANPAFGDADSSAIAGLASGTAVSATVAASGTAGWFRVIDRDQVAIMDGAVSTSGAEMNFDSTAFVAGGTVTINSFTVSTP